MSIELDLQYLNILNLIVAECNNIIDGKSFRFSIKALNNFGKYLNNNKTRTIVAYKRNNIYVDTFFCRYTGKGKFPLDLYVNSDDAELYCLEFKKVKNTKIMMSLVQYEEIEKFIYYLCQLDRHDFQNRVDDILQLTKLLFHQVIDIPALDAESLYAEWK